MDYVNGCDINTLSKFGLKRIANGKLKIIESLQDTLTYDSLSAMLTEAKTDFVNSDGKTIKDMPTAEIFYMTKKIDGQKYIIGLSYIKRIAGEPSGNTGVKAWFEASRDKLVEDRRIREGRGVLQRFHDRSLQKLRWQRFCRQRRVCG